MKFHVSVKPLNGTATRISAEDMLAFVFHGAGVHQLSILREGGDVEVRAAGRDPWRRAPRIMDFLYKVDRILDEIRDQDDADEPVR